MPDVLAKGKGVQPCVLERIVEPENRGCDGTLIGLHDECSTHTAILPFLRAVADGRRIIAPRSARWSAYGQGGLYSWFSSVVPPVVEPIGFGDTLMQLESFVLENRDPPSGRGTILIGIGQGGSMAVTLAALWPEVVGTVVAIDADWVRVPGWHVPERDMSGVAVLLVKSRAEARIQLRARRASVHESDETDRGESLADICRRWLSDREAFGSGKHV